MNSLNLITSVTNLEWWRPRKRPLIQNIRSSSSPLAISVQSRNLILINIFLILIYMQTSVDARFKRCFTCRSRGPLGDCRDPFTLNSTTFDGQPNAKPSIEAVPCASGWCAKITENDYGDSIAATERSCMTRPPTDNEERCSETIFENHRDRKVFLCMCYGDLCNSAIGSMRVLSWQENIKMASIAMLASVVIIMKCYYNH